MNQREFLDAWQEDFGNTERRRFCGCAFDCAPPLPNGSNPSQPPAKTPENGATPANGVQTQPGRIEKIVSCESNLTGDNARTRQNLDAKHAAAAGGAGEQIDCARGGAE